jgi:hypothetical protein
MGKSHIYIAVFFSGLTTLAAELAASRLLENHFGTSNLIYASIIGFRRPLGRPVTLPPDIPKSFSLGGFFIGLCTLNLAPRVEISRERI